MAKHHWFREYYEAILVAVIFTLFARTFVAQAFKIPTASMEENLLVGDHLFVNKFIYAPHLDTPLHAVLPYRDIERGDVVVFKYPQEPGRDFIKRAVAVGGDTVQVRTKKLSVNGAIEVNPHEMHKDPQVFPDSDAPPRPDPPTRQLRTLSRSPAGSSSAWATTATTRTTRGSGAPVPRSYFKGRALIIYWSFETRAQLPRVAWVVEPCPAACPGGDPFPPRHSLGADALPRPMRPAARAADQPTCDTILDNKTGNAELGGVPLPAGSSRPDRHRRRR